MQAANRESQHGFKSNQEVRQSEATIVAQYQVRVWASRLRLEPMIRGAGAAAEASFSENHRAPTVHVFFDKSIFLPSFYEPHISDPWTLMAQPECVKSTVIIVLLGAWLPRRRDEVAAAATRVASGAASPRA